MAGTIMNGLGVFGDEVYTSTDLNRRSGEVLNHARERPVTISRNNEQFALLRRELAAKIFGAVSQMQAAITVLLGVQAAIAGTQPSPVVSWVSIYDKDDLQKLCSELLNVTASAVFGNADWSRVDDLIHEWRESAIVAQTGVLDSVLFSEGAEETRLPSPDEVIASSAGIESEVACATK
jgi:hypothetical protein